MSLRRHSNIYGEEEESTEKVPEVNKFIQRIKEATREVEKVLRKTNEVIKRNADKEQRETIKHKKGDLVWVSGSNINSDQPTNKLAFKRADPFPVVKKVGSLAYELKILKMWKSLQLVTNLKPYHHPTLV